ncbi:MAG TPA: helix-turn-helix domain-containing protein [Longimicrobium sp.]|nr:helix-turn-helix domain-containing protein [Longimicrobium sp.]
MSQRDFPPIKESAEELKDLLAHEHSAKRRNRLHLLFLIRSDQVKSREEAASRLVVHRNTVWGWLEAYKAGGLAQMLRIGKTGPKPVQKSLSPPVFSALEKQLKDEGFPGYTHVQEWLRTQFGCDLPYNTVHKLVRYRLGAKLKRARPRHQKKRQ